MQAPRADRLGEGVGLDPQTLGHRGALQAFVKQLLRLGDRRGGQHRGTATVARPIEPFGSLDPIALYRPLEADLRHPEGPADLGLRGTAVDAELGGDHAKRGHVGFIVDEHRHAAVEVDDLPALFAERQQRRDGRDPLREKRQLHLGHREGLRHNTPGVGTAAPPGRRTGVILESGRAACHRRTPRRKGLASF